jgi:hypothetical protein
MADTFYPVSSYRSVMVTSGTQVEDVQVVTSATIPTGIRFTWAMPLLSWQQDSGVPQLNSMSAYLETLVTDHHVIGGTDSQDFDANNLLADFVDLTIAYDRPALGPLYGLASIPINAVALWAAGGAGQGFGGGPGLEDPAILCDDEYARLQALAGA